MEEKWEEISNYKDYYISNKGNVKSFKKGKFKILKQRNHSGYCKVGLYKNKKMKYVSVHRLVALHFVKNPENKPCVNHIDGNKRNNVFSNLEWCTIKENNVHAYKIGLKKVGEDNVLSKISKNEAIMIINLCKEKVAPQSMIARWFGIKTSTVSKIYLGRTWKGLER